MNNDELKALFDRQAAGYDTQWARMSPIRDNLHFLLESVLADLPDTARILCVGAGTGAEMSFLASRFPEWRFMALDPSGAMLEQCRQRAGNEGWLNRCDFHEGYVETLAMDQHYDAATCFLVSQFLLDIDARTAFFRAIAERLAPGAVLVSSDLAADTTTPEYDALLRVWLRVMSSAGLQPDAVERMRSAYARDVAILPPARVASIIGSAGFSPPIPFFQAGLIHAWYSRRR